MPYSEEKNILFIHIPKNAGKSIESSLGLVPDALLHKPQTRSLLNLFAKYLLNISQNRVMRAALFGAYDYVLCGQHLTVSEILGLNLITQEKFEAAYKFAVVRNPYDRALSTFRHYCGQNPDMDAFKRFWIDGVCNKLPDHNVLAHMRTQRDFLANSNGQIAVDKILRYEELHSDFKKMCEEANLGLNRLSEIRTHRRVDYRDCYDAEAAAIVASRFEADFESFGYNVNIGSPFVV